MKERRERRAPTRRQVIKGGAAAAAWWAAGAPLLGHGSLRHGGAGVGAAAAAGAADAAVPAALQFFTPAQFEAVALLCDHLIPRTDTPGARDAGVPEYLDRALAADEAEARREFARGLRWLERRARRRHGAELRALGVEQRIALLREVSDEHSEHPAALRAGADFFEVLKRRTIFGYYTSLECRTRELGLSDAVSTASYVGCRHRDGKHT